MLPFFCWIRLSFTVEINFKQKRVRMSKKSYDVIVVGAGPGGYVCAIRCAQLGLKTAVVEKSKTLGGTCLNVGCIPSKALLSASHEYEKASHELEAFGVNVSGVKLDLKRMMKHKSEVIDANTKGVEFLFKKNKIDWIQGAGSVAEAGKVSVKPVKGKAETYEADYIILATGSDVISLPNVDIDEKHDKFASNKSSSSPLGTR